MVFQSQEEQRIDGRGDNGVPSSHDSGYGGDHPYREARRGPNCRYVDTIYQIDRAPSFSFNVAYRLWSRIGRIAQGRRGL